MYAVRNFGAILSKSYYEHTLDDKLCCVIHRASCILCTACKIPTLSDRID